MRLFHPFETVDWARVSVTVAAVTAFWIGLAAIVPAQYHQIGMVILGSVSAGITILVRSNKWGWREETLTEKEEERKK